MQAGQNRDLPTNDWFIGEIVSAWIEDACLTDGNRTSAR
jgi:hypothetical protein